MPGRSSCSPNAGGEAGVEGEERRVPGKLVPGDNAVLKGPLRQESFSAWPSWVKGKTSSSQRGQKGFQVAFSFLDQSLMPWVFFNGKSELSVCVQSSFIPAPATSSLLTTFPINLSWTVASCFSLGVFFLPAAVSFLPVLIHKAKPVSLEESLSSGSMLCLSWHVPHDEHPAAAGHCGLRITRGWLKRVGPFLGIQAKPTSISRRGEEAAFPLVSEGAAGVQALLRMSNFLNVCRSVWFHLSFKCWRLRFLILLLCLSVEISRDGTWMGAVSHWAWGCLALWIPAPCVTHWRLLNSESQPWAKS